MAKFNINDLLNNQSKKPATEDTFVIRQIPLGQIIPSDKNIYGIRDLEELATNIEEFGLMHNLVVKEANADGLFEIISGERRYRACKMLFEAGDRRFASLPCKVENEAEEEITELKILYANAMARELTDYEKTYQMLQIKELLQELKNKGHTFKGRMRKNVADILNVSSSQIGRMESISKKLSPEFKEEFKKGNIGITQAYDLSTMPGEDQADALKEYRETGSTKIETKKKAAKKPPVNADAAKKPLPKEASGDCVCCYCRWRFDGRKACNGNMDITAISCPECGHIMNFSIRFFCTPLDMESEGKNE